MIRVLFVDDQPRILDGLQRMLRPLRHRWETAFAASGEAALALLSERQFDVIISDMRMPEMDGMALLSQVRDRFPGVVRMVLSGYTSLEATLRAFPVAHQFLVKPCDPNLLRVAVERACGLKMLLGSDLIFRTVGGMRDLPHLPRTYAALVQALSNPEVSLDAVARIVERDVAVSARVMQLVNSPMFGLTRHITTVRTAVSYLGVDVLKNMVLSVEAFGTFSGVADADGFSFEQIHDHAYLAARIAARLPGEKQIREIAQVAALLHDVGKLVLMARLPGVFTRVVQLARKQSRVMHEVEMEVIGVTHAEVGAYLLGLWGLPFPIIEAVAYHHRPGTIPHQIFDALAAVHVADILAHRYDSSPRNRQFAAPHFDERYLEDLKVTGQVGEWNLLAAEVTSSKDGALS